MRDRKLTDRENQIVRLVANGMASTEIAQRLHISHHTVATHRRNIMEKLQLDCLAALIKYAIRNGLTSLE